jgi:hypothetical protein
MSDILNVTGSNYTSGSIERGESSVQLNTGALRRKYNFGDMVSELALAQDPFFRFVSMVAKKPTDDPSFKFTERRSSYTKRYAYIADYDSSAAAVPATAPGSTSPNPAAGDVYTFGFFTDYNSNGNNTNIYGQVHTYAEGVEGTQPQFFIPGQIIKVPVGATGTENDQVSNLTGYTLWKVNSVDLDTQGVATTANSQTINKAIVNATCLKAPATCNFMNSTETTGTATDGSPALGAAATLAGITPSSETLEAFKCYVVGTAFAAGSGYPETWQDQPFSTGHGQTQIFKTSCVMNNTDRATVLKYEGNEWARIWKEKLIEHKWDIENSLLFGNQSSTYNTTEGAVNFISTYGNAFSMDLTTKSQDSFLDDLSAMLDPRYNNAGSTVFFCSTAVYNWLHKLSGYFANNVGMVVPNSGNTTPTPQVGIANGSGQANFAMSDKKKVFGIDITTISTIYGDMNVARNVHLDGTSVKMIGINMKYCAYRPLVGNGINRDTGVYVGVQTLENSGVDRRVDQILTEAGMEWCCPETHAIWS